MKKAKTNAKREPKDATSYQTQYDILPRYMTKMLRIFKKYRLEWSGTGWGKEEATGILVGSKENLVAFLCSTYKSMNRSGRWVAISRENALEQIEPNSRS